MTDKELIRAEIERLRKHYQGVYEKLDYNDDASLMSVCAKRNLLLEILLFIDSMQEEQNEDWRYSIAQKLGLSKEEFDKIDYGGFYEKEQQKLFNVKQNGKDCKEYPASKNLNEEINKQFNYTKRYRQKLFNEDCAIYGDVYMYDGEKLIFVCCSTPEPKRKTWFGKIKHYFWCKKNGIVIDLNRRTLEYIYNVCKGTMPSSKEEFVKCIIGTIKED